MAAFRFLALLTVGFVLLMLIFLLHAGQSRLEIEGKRILEGPEMTIGESQDAGATWTIDLGGVRVEEAWPAAQRQPHLGVRAAPAGAMVTASAHYVDEDGERVLDAFIGGGPLTRSTAPGTDGDDPREVSFGPIWMSWEHPLVIELEADQPVELQPVLSGEPSINYVAARQMARTLWIVFSIIGVLGFIGLLVTLREPRAEMGPTTTTSAH